MANKKNSQHITKRMLVLSLAFLATACSFADTAEEYSQRVTALFNNDSSRATNIKSKDQKIYMKATFESEEEQMSECHSTDGERKAAARNSALNQLSMEQSSGLKKN